MKDDHKQYSKDYIYNSLAEASTSMNVIGRGTIVMDPDEIVSSDSFKEMAKISKEIVSEEKFHRQK